MSKKEDFKKFISNKPEIIDYVKNNNVSWQTLFEVYDIYGEKESVWSKYIKQDNISIKNILNSLKNINMDSLEENISSIQKAVGFVEELTKPSDKKEEKATAKKEESIERFYSD